MNTVSQDLPGPLPRAGGARGTLAAWRGAIASLGPTQWKWAAAIGLFGTVLQCGMMLGEASPSVSLAQLMPIFASTAISWGVQVPLGLCAWAIAERSDAATEKRAWRLGIALAAAVLLQAALVPVLSDLLIGRLDPCVFHGCEGKDWSKVPSWLMHTESSGHMLIFGSLIFAWLEVQRRNRETEQRLLASQQERARLQRSAFDARLTAMRAQVDPQFLFDSLADVQAAYATDGARGAATLDLLIAYLRTALPRLRSEGSTVGAEADLVDAWLAVVAARRGGQPSRQLEIDPSCLDVPFPATVLLPLVQWAVGGPGASASAVWLSVRRLQPGGGLRAQVRIAPGRPCCDEDPESSRIRERLRAMYGDAAGLTCEREGPGPASDASAIAITLHWPDESADRDRR